MPDPETMPDEKEASGDPLAPPEYAGRFVNPTCEHMTHYANGVARFCRQPTVLWYPAMGGGTAALCEEHGATHRPFAYRYEAPTDA